MEISIDVIKKIDWDGIEKASKTLTISRKIWLLKHVSGFAPTASKMVHRRWYIEANGIVINVHNAIPVGKM